MAPVDTARCFAGTWVVWTVLTRLSTVLVATLADHLNLQVAWLAKPVIEEGLAVMIFSISRH